MRHYCHYYRLTVCLVTGYLYTDVWQILESVLILPTCGNLEILFLPLRWRYFLITIPSCIYGNVHQRAQSWPVGPLDFKISCMLILILCSFTTSALWPVGPPISKPIAWRKADRRVCLNDLPRVAMCRQNGTDRIGDHQITSLAQRPIYRVAQNKIPHRRICNISATSGLILKILEAAYPDTSLNITVYNVSTAP